MRINNILHNAEVQDEYVLFSCCFEKKDYNVTSEMESLKEHFKNLFNTQASNLKLDEAGERLLASAWYAICIDQPFTVKNKPLLGLPWMIYEKICKLSKFVREEESKSVKKGLDHIMDLRMVIRIGELIDEISFMRKDAEIIVMYRNISFKHFQSRKFQFKYCASFMRIFQNSIPNEESLEFLMQEIDRATTNIVYNLVVNFFAKIRKRFFARSSTVVYWNKHQVMESDLVKIYVKVCFFNISSPYVLFY